MRRCSPRPREFEAAFGRKAHIRPVDIRQPEVVEALMEAAFQDRPKRIRLVATSPAAFPSTGATERLVPERNIAAHGTNHPLGRPGRLQELADLAAFLVSDHAAYIQGECVAIDGGAGLRAPAPAPSSRR